MQCWGCFVASICHTSVSTRGVPAGTQRENLGSDKAIVVDNSVDNGLSNIIVAAGIGIWEKPRLVRETVAWLSVD